MAKRYKCCPNVIQRAAFGYTYSQRNWRIVGGEVVWEGEK